MSNEPTREEKKNIVEKRNLASMDSEKIFDDKIQKLAFYDQQVKKSSFHDINRKVKARSQSDKCNIILLREDRMKNRCSDIIHVLWKKNTTMYAAWAFSSKKLLNAFVSMFLLRQLLYHPLAAHILLPFHRNEKINTHQKMR